ncbi:MAG TPA: NADH-quinone oxidoreductase subunit K [Cyclobacteriaceae bacterium]|jgi:hydrogenase-4 component E|nr:NADH-quinone oxidoreductase subunit K [Cyclobacteriaceae bacterium]
MISLLIISFGVTLIYLAVAERMKTYNTLIAVQGLLLFFITYIELESLDVWHLVLILLETLVIKVFVLPYFIHRLLIKKSGDRSVTLVVPGYISLTIVSVIIFFSFLLSYLLHDQQIQVKYFTGAIAAIFTGLYLIIVHKQVFTHMMGYLTIENGIFLLSLAIGNEMPLLVNLAVLLDVFSSVLILGIFIDRLESFSTLDVDQLKELKD